MYRLPMWVSVRKKEETRLWSEFRRHEFLGTTCWADTCQSENECLRREQVVTTVLKGPEPVTKRVRMLQDVCEVWNNFDKYVLAGHACIPAPDSADGSSPVTSGFDMPTQTGDQHLPFVLSLSSWKASRRGTARGWRRPKRQTESPPAHRSP